MKSDTELLIDQYLDRCSLVWNQMKELDEEYQEKRHGLKMDLAQVIEDGKYNADLQITEVANRLETSRQHIHRIVLEVHGVRHPDKQKAGQLGGTANQEKNNSKNHK